MAPKDIKTGDSDFDAAFVVKGDDPPEVISGLDGQRRSAPDVIEQVSYI